jgi:hypothetical protein
LAVPEAAGVLGISADAVRSRIKRGTLRTVREGGRVFVVLVGTDRAQPTNRPRATSQPTDPSDDLREQVAYLREQLRREQEAHGEARRIIAGLVQRIPELEAPQEQPPETRESPETPSEGPEDASDRPAAPGPQTAPQRVTLRGLRWRIFGR